MFATNGTSTTGKTSLRLTGSDRSYPHHPAVCPRVQKAGIGSKSNPKLILGPYADMSCSSLSTLVPLPVENLTPVVC